MEAFHGKKEVKKVYLDRVVAHRKADEIVKGHYWEEGKGCAVGCTIHGSDHSRYETELGIPTWLAKLEDRLFEGVSNKYAVTFPEKFLKAINPGADLNKIKSKFLCYVITQSLKQFDHKKYPTCASSIKDIIAALKRGETDKKVWHALRSAAAAAAAAYAADAAYAAYAAAAAAAAAAYAADAAYAAYAAYAAAYATRSTAREKEYEKFANHLLKLLKGCK